MKVFADTSALYALLVGSDVGHPATAKVFPDLLLPEVVVYTTSYVRQELITLLQARVGIPSVLAFQAQIEPWMRLVWIDEATHSRAMSALVGSGSRRISLTDWTSFEVMRSQGISIAFALDAHFAEQGFVLMPALTPR